jgi:2,4-dichlorophenol 6-monooxygenase
MENGMNHVVVGEAMGSCAGRTPTPTSPACDVRSAMRRTTSAIGGERSPRSRCSRWSSASTAWSTANVRVPAIVDDGSPRPASLDDVQLYVAGTRPGAPLPHAELEDPDGRRLPLMASCSLESSS